MNWGLGVFIACDVLGALLAAVSCRRTWRSDGHAAAVREAAVMTASLGAYTAVCLWLGFTIGAQCLALVASLIPLLLGRRYLPPSIRDYMGGNR